jgi:L-serine dehydratase
MAKPISILNHVLGPVMRGPSSSHSAAALRIGRLCRDLLGGRVTAVDCEYDPNGSLATTHLSQGSDLGLTGGLLGWDASDARLLKYREHARAAGLRFDVHTVELGATHPNTYRLQVYNGDEHHQLTALSLGGGMIEVIDIDGLPLSMEGDQYVLIALGRDGRATASLGSMTPFTQAEVSEFQLQAGASAVRQLAPVVPVCGADDTGVPFQTVAEMRRYDGAGLQSLPELALAYEAQRSGLSERDLRERVGEVLSIMRESLRVGSAGTDYADRILPSQVGRYQQANAAGQLLGGACFNDVVTAVTAVLEAKSAMQVLVAAPTAGSCGVIPGALLGVAQSAGFDDATLVDGLLTAGLIGVFIATGATFAAEEGGCMAECGSASAMAAAALVVMSGGSTDQALAAASQALQNSFGMTCDTVANRVEAPCLGKNTMAAANALAAANMALAGFDPLIPLDEVIVAMAEVGRQMPREVRCTGLGGIAVCPSSKAIEARLADAQPRPIDVVQLGGGKPK